MNTNLRLIFVTALTVGTSGCLRGGARPVGGAAPESPRPWHVTPLNESVSPLRDAFNQDVGRHRFVALLSPT